MAQELHRIAVAVFPEVGDHALPARNATALAEGRAFEWPTTLTREALAVDLPEADVAVLPRQGRRKRLLICDMDSTLIGQECIDELADYAGVKAEVSAITERAMRGEIGFEGALRERVALLEGLPESVVDECYAERIRLNAGARTLARTMAASGAKTVIVSGGFTAFSARVAADAGFAHHRANRLLFENGRFTGRVAAPILGRDAKRAALMTFSDARPDTAIAIGDGANDLAMIEAAGIGVAFHAKPAVAAAALCAIERTDLTTALFFQGFREAEFVGD